MIEWEYHVIRYSYVVTYNEITANLNMWGADGWEAVQLTFADTWVACLKRPKPPKTNLEPTIGGQA